MILSISSFKNTSLDPKIFFGIAAAVINAAAVNPLGNETF